MSLPLPRAVDRGELHILDSGPKDAELVARLRAGPDEWAAEALYRRYAALALGTAIRLMRNRAEAEDVVQDTFIHAFDRIHQLQDPAAFRGWLLRIVVSMVHRRLRRAFWRKRVEPVDGLEAEAAGPANPEVRAELKLLDEALSRIQQRDRIPWILRNVMGLRLEEVADACDCSLATVKRRIASAQAIVARHVRVEVDHD